eukprot:TRINITY_DN494_c0_g1_i2.p1 TRINITY_DN494_c0_g1~~TRINITY_DN494_c0_g1_i2.p1  ORF type:complete len:666 (-),score=151.13 TRINITY_DN494_c0_g1_i2:168-2165(-)
MFVRTMSLFVRPSSASLFRLTALSKDSNKAALFPQIGSLLRGNAPRFGFSQHRSYATSYSSQTGKPKTSSSKVQAFENQLKQYNATGQYNSTVQTFQNSLQRTYGSRILDEVTLAESKIVKEPEPAYAQRGYSRSSRDTADNSLKLGSAENPLHISTIEPPPSAQGWKFIRQIVGAFILLSLMTSMIEDKIGKPGGSALLPSSEVHVSKNVNVKFSDVLGVDEAVDELQEIVEYLRDPEKFTRLGGKLPKGVLLVGQPGTGKTLLARAIAGEAGVPFLYASGSEFDEMFVGVGARRIRNLFDTARQNKAAIIFIDEIDAVGGKRNPRDQQYARMTLNQLLVEMDGFSASSGIIVIAATNTPDALDPALIRPGRFDRSINIPLPDIEGRTKIIDHYLKAVPAHPDISVNTLARGTAGFTGADLSNLVNIAALKAAKDQSAYVNMEHLEYARDRVLMGAERKSAKISDESKALTAYHEGGHALVAILTKGATPVYKATIMPRGSALGMVTQLPEKDETFITKEQLLARMDVCMGGRMAEEIIFGEQQITTGASSDIQQATRIARAMVERFGMSSLGTVDLSGNETAISPETMRKVETEIQLLVDTAKNNAKTLLTKNIDKLDLIASALLEYETLSGTEINDILAGKPIRGEKKPFKAKKQHYKRPES